MGTQYKCTTIVAVLFGVVLSTLALVGFETCHVSDMCRRYDSCYIYGRERVCVYERERESQKYTFAVGHCVPF